MKKSVIDTISHQLEHERAQVQGILERAEKLTVDTQLDDSTSAELDSIIKWCHQTLDNNGCRERETARLRAIVDDCMEHVEERVKNAGVFYKDQFATCEKDFKILSWLIYLTGIYLSCIKLLDEAIKYLHNNKQFGDKYFFNQSCMYLFSSLLIFLIFAYLEVKFFFVLTARLDVCRYKIYRYMLKRSSSAKSTNYMRSITFFTKFVPYIFIALTIALQAIVSFLIITIRK